MGHTDIFIYRSTGLDIKGRMGDEKALKDLEKHIDAHFATIINIMESYEERFLALENSMNSLLKSMGKEPEFETEKTLSGTFSPRSGRKRTRKLLKGKTDTTGSSDSSSRKRRKPRKSRKKDKKEKKEKKEKRNGKDNDEKDAASKLQIFHEISNNHGLVSKIAAIRNSDLCHHIIGEKGSLPSWFKLMEESLTGKQGSGKFIGKVEITSSQKKELSVSVDTISDDSTENLKEKEADENRVAEITIQGHPQFNELMIEFSYHHRGPTHNPAKEFEMKKIAQGGNGIVYRAVHTDTGFLLCVKIINILSNASKMQNADAAKTIRTEIGILKKCKHPRVVGYYAALRYQDHVWILMELCGGGSLDQLCEYYHSHGKLFKEKDLIYVSKSFIDGLDYLHGAGVVHRDVKPANILITIDGKIKLGDFGSSGLRTQNKLDASAGGVIDPVTKQFTTVTGTILFMAPEIIGETSQKYGTKVDIWSVGMTLLYLIDCDNFFQSKSMLKIVSYLLDTSSKYRAVHQAKFSEGMNELIQSCLAFEYDDRPTAKQLLDLPLFVDAEPEAKAIVRFRNSINDYLAKAQK